MNNKLIPTTAIEQLFQELGAVAQHAGYPIYAVGGYVRDRLLGLPVGREIDFVIVGDAMTFAQRLKKELNVSDMATYARYGTFMTHYRGFRLEFVNARSESYEQHSRNPKTEQADLDTDLHRRDFTINALALDLTPGHFCRLIDIFNGQADLEAGIIRTPLDPAATFYDDPLRMMRAIRFATRFHFTIAPDTWQGIREHAERLQIITVERIQDEFNKILMTEKPSEGLRLLDESGLLNQFLPEADAMKGVEQRKDFHHKDVFYHTLQVIDNVAAAGGPLNLRLAALFHDIAKPRTKRFEEGTGWTFHGHEVVGERMSKAILRRLKYSNDTIAFVAKLVRMHLRPMALVSDEVTDSAIRRLLFLAGDDFDALMTLCRADITSKNPARVKKYIRNYDILLEKVAEVEERDRIRNFQPPVDGREIMEVFGVKQGRVIGVAKKFLEEAILEGTVPNEHDACLELLRQNWDKLQQQI
ncbi:MAG: HD domain-containing protein [Calditrichaeota bacterium]|nr:MAG: HD domain-containing protein [Calditrichota bacterium]